MFKHLKRVGCREEPIVKRTKSSYPRWDYWCQKLNPSARAKKTVHEAGWIPVQISEDEPSGIDLRIGRITIAIKPGFDPSLLTDVLRTINTLC